MGIVSAVACVDYLTGSEFTFSVFYLIPVLLSVVLSGRKMGVFISVLCAAIWFYMDKEHLFSSMSVGLIFWDVSIKLLFFLVFMFLTEGLIGALWEIRHLSLHDPLTNAANRRYFEEFAQIVLKRSQRNGLPLTFALFDLDNFKKLNDTKGHSAGDEALRIISGSIMLKVRPDDILARIGGDEFILLLYGMDYTSANHVLTRIIEDVRHEMFVRDWDVTMSVGAVTCSDSNVDIEEILRIADMYAYKVKNGGKNGLHHVLYPEQNDK